MNNDTQVSTDTVLSDTTVTTTTETPQEVSKRAYTRSTDMALGNDLILRLIPTGAANAVSKKQIFKEMSDTTFELVNKNWNLRIQSLEKDGLVKSTGAKAGKKYFLPE
jgi:hypothetical protein